jgi:hypothetical protein
MCRVCLKRPEIPDERYGRCEPCARAGRIVYRFRVLPRPTGELVIKAGELSPRATRQKLHAQLAGFKGKPSVKPHLTLHDVEVVLAKDRLESVRISGALAGKEDAVMAALAVAADRTEAAW